MAARRVASSAVNWAAFAERVPVNQREQFRACKAKSEAFIAKVHRFPENLPSIDFAFYRSRLANPALVEQFEKGYKSVTVPYPKDHKNIKGHVDTQEKLAAEEMKTYVAAARTQINDSKELLNKIDSIPAYEYMTYDMFAYYFPDASPDPVKRPSFWPHTKETQPENDSHYIN